MKKKKKKKKTPFDLEGALNEGGEDAPETKDDDGAGEDIDLENFGKKKKKKKTVKLEEDEDEAEDGGEFIEIWRSIFCCQKFLLFQRLHVHTTHSVEITENFSDIFLEKFRENNVFTKEVTKE